MRVHRGKALHCVLCFIATAMISSCATRNVSGPVDFHATEGAREIQSAAGTDYVMQPGDVLDVKFYYTPELNERVTIRPDGKISLQLVEEIKAAGLTPAELDAILVEKYSRILQQPEITVIMREFAGQKVYIGGEVATPKTVSLSGEMTALQAILNAGGLKETAYSKSVVIISKGPKNTPVARMVDLSGVITGEAPENDVVLRPFDIVYVPKTFIAELNKFVEQYIKNMIPGTLTGGFYYTTQHTILP